MIGINQADAAIVTARKTEGNQTKLIRAAIGDVGDRRSD